MESNMDRENLRMFGWVDYLIFSLTLLVSALVGVYHALKETPSTSEYLLGGKKVAMVPIALSMSASALSATTMLGNPTDTYLTGGMVIWMTIGSGIGMLLANVFLLPFYHRLNIISANEYLELRFHQWIRRFASLLSLIRTLFYLAIVVFAPSLALSQVTGIHVYISMTIVFAICIFYTAIGGMKAVVWSDTIQVFLMYGATICVLVKGISDVGGWNVTWQRNTESGRNEFFNIDIDPRTRHTLWSVVIGGGIYWCSYIGTDQASIQRFLAIPNLRKAYWAMFISWFGILLVQIPCVLLGLTMYAKYHNCDPISNKDVSKADQVVPFFVMETIGSIPGLPGLYVAGVFSGALSTLSSGIGAAPLTILEDFIRPFGPQMSDQKATLVAKVTTVLFGLTCFALAFLAANVKTILEASIAFVGSITGPILGVFTLGIFFPRANAIGAGFGLASSIACTLLLSIATQIAKSHNLLRSFTKPLTTEGCTVSGNLSSLLPLGQFNVNFTQNDDPPLFSEAALSVLNISYQWYTMIGMLIVWIVGLGVSLATRPPNPTKKCLTYGSKRTDEVIGIPNQDMDMK